MAIALSASIGAGAMSPRVAGAQQEARQAQEQAQRLRSEADLAQRSADREQQRADGLRERSDEASKRSAGAQRMSAASQTGVIQGRLPLVEQITQQARVGFSSANDYFSGQFLSVMA